ncbi:MAG TPA: hypothetical protein VK752_17600 [Bryobacteraceae bacterium]|nr:hypothetical protein [Bryobacteraceae bacterium]
MNSEAVLGLANYELTGIEHSGTVVRITTRYLGSVACPDCQGEKLRSKGPVSAKRASRKLGKAALLVDPGGAQVVVPESVRVFRTFSINL